MLFFDGAGGAVDPEEVEGEEDDNEEDDDSQGGDDGQGGKASDPDPLDDIKDEKIRNEMKALRAKSRRNAGDDKPLKAEPKKDTQVPPPSAYATKDDLKKLANNDAKKLVAPEVKDVWAELLAVPLGGFDPMDAESIAANMARRYELYRMDHPQGEEDPSKEFMKSPPPPNGGGSGGGKKPQKQDSRPLPGFKEPTDPKDWYPAPK